MPSPFQAIDIASSALRAFQAALDVTGNNISNVNTPGYSRQTVGLTTVDSTTFYGTSPQSIGQGVGVATINRIQDAFLAASKLVSQADVGASQTLSDQLSQVESTLNDTSGAGIGNDLDSFFNAWSALAANPNETALQSQVQQAGETLTQDLQGAYTSLTTQGASQANGVTQTFQQINALTSQIATLNDQIREKSAGGAEPNDLLDQRDSALTSLSNLVNIKTYTMSDGSVAVYMNQRTLVDNSGSKPLPPTTTFNAAAGTITDANGTYNVTSGQLSGLFQAMNNTTGYENQLNTLATNLSAQVNALHQAGTNSLGNTGLNFFAGSLAGGDFDLDPTIKANAQAIATGTSGNSGDNGLANQIAQLSTTPVAALGNQTLSAYYTGVIGQVGTDSANAQTNLKTKTAVDSQVDAQIQSISGVSLDDEMSNMLQFQRSYEAAAKALSVFDQTTDDLINIIQ